MGLKFWMIQGYQIWYWVRLEWLQEDCLSLAEVWVLLNAILVYFCIIPSWPCALWHWACLQALLRLTRMVRDVRSERDKKLKWRFWGVLTVHVHHVLARLTSQIRPENVTFQGYMWHQMWPWAAAEDQTCSCCRTISAAKHWCHNMKKQTHTR